MDRSQNFNRGESLNDCIFSAAVLGWGSFLDLHFPHRFSNGYKIPADESYSVNGAMIYNQSIQLTNSNEIFQQNFLRKAVHHTYRKTGPLHRCLKIEFSKKDSSFWLWIHAKQGWWIHRICWKRNNNLTDDIITSADDIYSCQLVASCSESTPKKGYKTTIFSMTEPHGCSGSVEIPSPWES